MKVVEPKIFIIAESAINDDEFARYLESMEVPGWTTDAHSDAEALTEIAGKACYQSFSTDLNKNLTKVGGRNNMDYIQQGIVGQKHGSVLEHSTVTLVFADVSRVLTHELVRHRVGAAYSQESGRYVRTDVVRMYIPPEILANEHLATAFIDLVDTIESGYKELERISGVDSMTDFTAKKKMTSALRRVLPNGMANTIICTFNHRTLRHLLALRTSRGAEVEIRLAFYRVFEQIRGKFPAIYADAELVSDDETGWIPEIHFKHDKI